MGFEKLLVLLFVGCVAAQTYKVCIPTSSPTVCQSLDKDGSQATCHSVESRIDCALKIWRGEADIGYFSEEEVLLLAHQYPNDNRIIATVRDVNRMEPYAFEAVAVVPSTHQGGLEGLRNGRYCHPGFDVPDLRWSPRVLRELEYAAAQSNRISSNDDTSWKTVESFEVEALSRFFSSACRPGPWSANDTVDAQLKNDFPSLCSLCGGSCSSYSIEMGAAVPGVSNENRHIQALECLRTNSNQETSAVAYVAWQHAREFFSIRNPLEASSFSLLCPNGTLVPIQPSLNNATAPCAFIRQPWGAVVTTTSKSEEILTNMRSWWPAGSNPGGNTWQSVLFTALAGGSNARVVFEDLPVAVSNYTAGIRELPSIDASPPMFPPHRWCTTSDAEQNKCTWLRSAAYVLGLQPTISCVQRSRIFECLQDISDGIADFIASPSNYGYIARQHFKLTPVKMVQNQRAAASRIAAFVKESAALQNNITRFENLRNGRACFPEYGGLAYVSFVMAGRERGVLDTSECDYARLVGEFFSAACAPGAVDASHKLSDTTFETESLCSVCKPLVSTQNATDFSATIGGLQQEDNVVSAAPTHAELSRNHFISDHVLTCAWDYTNMYYGNNGSLACLADPSTDVAFVNVANISEYLRQLNLQPTQFRALCRNNTLASQPGVDIDDACALAYVVDSEIVTRRNNPSVNSINVFLDAIDQYFGYNAATGTQLINFEIFSPFDGKYDVLFKDTTIGLTEPTTDSAHEPAKNYIQLFQHLDQCNSAFGLATRSIYSIFSTIILVLVSRFII